MGVNPKTLVPAPAEDLAPSASPAEAIRELVLASGGVSEDEASLLLTVLRQLEIIELTQGREAARLAADRIRRVWLAEFTEVGEIPPSRLN